MSSVPLGMLLSTHHLQEVSLTPYCLSAPSTKQPKYSRFLIPYLLISTCPKLFSASCLSVSAAGGQKRLVIEAAEQRAVLCSDWYKQLCWLMLLEAEGIVHWRTSNITLKMSSNIITLSSISCKAYPLSYRRSFHQGYANISRRNTQI